MRKPSPLLAVAACLALASLLPAPYASLWPDTVRDLSASLALARGEAWPLQGPPINFGPHLGPAWIWLQALPLLFIPSLTSTALYVAAVAGLRFVLLYELGRRWSGPRLGLCFAAAAAFPTFWVFEWQAFFHPDWVATAICASLLALAIAVRERRTGWLVAAFVLLGLAVQLHPTALYYAPLHVVALYTLVADARRRLLHAALLAGSIAIWFVPLVFAPGSESGPWQAGASRLAEGLAAFRFGDVATVLRTAYWEIPQAVGETYGAGIGVPTPLWTLMISVFGIAALLGLGRALLDRASARAALALVALLLAGFAIAVAVRTYTSFYLCYFLLPLSALTLGYGLDSALRSFTAPVRAVGAAGVIAGLAMFGAAVIGAALVGRSGAIASRVPALGELRHPAPVTVSARMLGAAARDAITRAACAQPRSVTAHGDLAYAWGGSTALDFRMHCPGHAAATLLGSAQGAPDWTVLTVAEAREIGRPPLLEVAGIALLPVKRALHPTHPRPIEREWYYFEQLRDRQPMTRVSLDFLADASDVVAIHRLKPFDSSWSGLHVAHDGTPAASFLTTFNSTAYRAQGATGHVRWHVEFDTDAPQWVDVYTL